MDLSRLATAPVLAAAVAFAVLFYEPFVTLVRDWLNDPDAGHGLLLAPLAIWLAWRAGLAPERKPRPVVGVVLLAAAVALRYAAGLAAELFTLRMSMMAAAGALVVYLYGWAQIRRWWLPVALLVLSVPLPSVVLNTIAMPLQFQASQMGAGLLEWRQVPVRLAGNVIHLPGQTLFVTEACSGLRSLTALLSLGLLTGGLWLRTALARGALLTVVIPVAILINGVRVFLTGFLVYFVDPALGQGFMHYTEGWALFVISFGILGAATAAIGAIEGAWLNRRPRETGFPGTDVQEAIA
jgi:exosortase